MPLRRILLVSLLLAAAPASRAGELRAEAAPFVAAEETPAAPSEGLRTFAAARRALELGFPGIAAGLFTRLLDAPQPVGEDHDALVLDLASALLDDGREGEAAKALEGYAGPRGAAYHVRAGLAAMRSRKLDTAKAELAAVKADDLAPGDRGWYHFLQGRLADAAGDFSKARDAYQRASAAAVSDFQRAHFALAREQARLNLGEVTESQVAALRQSAERYRGRNVGYAYARQYAAGLAALGRKSEAVDYLNVQLGALPAGERAAGDDFRLLLGLVDGARNQSGRKALEELLAGASDPDLQRVALQLLARSAADNGAIGGFLDELEKLGAAVPASPILEDILLVRAQLALTDTGREDRHGRAESAAKELLAKFPGSPLKPAALGVLASAAWEQRRYRTAADYAMQAGALLPPGDLRSSLGVLVAEAYFRAGDFRSADDAYAEALKAVPSGVSPGLLMAQRVRSEIEEKQLDAAQALLDAFARDPRLDAINRWQSEWVLSQALQLAGRTSDALARVDGLMASAGGDAKALPPGLRARLSWLQARLALDAGLPEKTLDLTAALAGRLDGIGPALRAQVEASLRLLQAKADFRLERPEPALALLESLRKDFPATDAAMYSYIDEADYYGGKNNLGEAQARLIKLADMLKTTPVLADKARQQDYAAYALYRAALYAERRGEDKYYKEAYTILERINQDYPRSPLVFAARLKQGDLLRRLNQFGPAQQIYEFLLNNYAGNTDAQSVQMTLSAQMALAACHRAQVGAGDVSHFESAATIYERIQELATASADMRAEASFQLGDLYAARGRPDDLARARDVWWTLVTTFLLDDAQAARLGVQGRYWTARALLRLGDLYAGGQKLEQARNAYDLILRKGLPFAQLARECLIRAGGKP